MPLNNNDYVDILRHLRKNLSRSGFGAMDARIISGLRGSEGPQDDLRLYMRALIDEFALGSNELQRKTIARIRQNASTADGGDIQGVRIDLSPSETMRYGVDSIDLSQTTDVQEIIFDLKMLLSEIEEDLYKRWSDNSEDDE